MIFSFSDQQDDLPKDYKDGQKITLPEVVKTVSWGEMRFLTQVFIMISVLFWLTRAFAVFHHFVQYWDIKGFYNTALNIPDSSLGKTSSPNPCKFPPNINPPFLLCRVRDLVRGAAEAGGGPD